MTGLEEKLRAKNPCRWLEHTVAVAVSGGADSVALLRFFVGLWKTQKPAGRIVALHANHQLRGEESDGDARFVRELCDALDVPCIVRRLEISRTSDGLEQDARAARYAFLEQAALDAAARYLVTAHNQNDQVETILHRLLRGTGVAGLAGIAPLRKLPSGLILLRPLLDVTREEILEYLASLEQTYRVDSSNTDTRLTRNRIRRKLVPFLTENFNPKLDAAILRLGEIASETRDFLHSQTERLLHAAVTSETGRIRIRLDALKEEPLFLRKELLRHVWHWKQFPEQDMGKEQWTALFTLLTNDGTRLFPGNIRVEHQGDMLEIRWESVNPSF